MISAIREWLCSIVICTLFLSILRAMLPEGAVKQVGNFTGGLLLLLCVLSPLLHLDGLSSEFNFSEYRSDFEEQQKLWAEDGERALTQRIEEETESYISDKANAIGAEVSVSVETEKRKDGIIVPTMVHLTGPYVSELSVCIQQELGIPPERQVWDEENR